MPKVASSYIKLISSIQSQLVAMKFEAKFLSMFRKVPSKLAAYEIDLQAKLIRRNDDLDSRVGGTITCP